MRARNPDVRLPFLHTVDRVVVCQAILAITRPFGCLKLTKKRNKMKNKVISTFTCDSQSGRTVLVVGQHAHQSALSQFTCMHLHHFNSP
jgi:hypothetical protein